MTTETLESEKYSASDWNKLERERDWYRSRVQLLEKSKAMFREPELTIICDIMANGQLLPDADGARYGPNGQAHPTAAGVTGGAQKGYE